MPPEGADPDWSAADPAANVAAASRMKTAIGLVLICGGLWLFHDGWRARDSLKGRTQSTLAGLARHIDGETRVPEHSWYMVAGGVAMLAGIGLIYSGRKR